MKARVIVEPKEGVLDPQGQAIQRSLQKMGHGAVQGVRQGKYFEIEFQPETSLEEARRITESIAHEVLSNPLIENYRIEDIS